MLVPRGGRLGKYSGPHNGFLALDRYLLVDGRGVCPSIENFIVWCSENMLGRTAAGDIEIASSFGR